MKKKILAMMMSCALFATMLPTTVLAEVADNAESQTENAAVITEEEDNEVSSDTISIGDGTYDIEIGTDADSDEFVDVIEAGDVEVMSDVGTDADEPTDAAVDEEVTEEAEDVTYTAETDGIKVEVKAPAEALPEGAVLSAERYAEDSAEYKEAADAINYESTDENGMAALDISFYVDGEEVEPTEPVEVSIDVSQILPSDTDKSSLEVQHLEEIGSSINPVVVANDSAATEGTIDTSRAVAEFTVDTFSEFTVSWTITTGPQAGSSYTVNVTAYLDGTELDITDGLTFSSENDELDFETLLSDVGYGTGDYTFSYAIGTIGNVTYGSEDNPIAAVEITTGTGTGPGTSTYFHIVYMDGTYVDVATSSYLSISAYYTTPSLSVEIVAVDEDEAEDWQLKAVVSHAAEGSTLSYEWWITDTDGGDTELAYVTNTDNTGQAFIVWSDDVEDNDEVVVHVSVTATDASGNTETAEASYTLEYGDETVDLIMTYGPNQTALPAGVTVTLTNEATGKTYEFETEDDGWVHDAEIEPGIYIVSATYTVDGNTYQCSEEISLHDAGNYSINLNYYNPDILTSVPDKDDWEHIDIKLSIGTSGSASAEGVTLDITSATIYTSTGEVRATTTEVTGNDNEFQLHWSANENSHATSFTSTDYIVIYYTLTEDGVTSEYSITIGPDTVYASGTTYPVTGQRAYKLYNYLYGTSYESDAQLIAAGIGDIDISGMSLFLVAAILCDSSEVTGAGQLDVSSAQAGMDFALSINTINELATSWQFEVEKTYYNASMLAGNFEFVLYDATADGDTWTQGSANSTLTNSQAGIGQEGYSQDTMESLAIAYSDEDIQSGATYYYILSETPNVTSSSGAEITFDETVYGIKVELGTEGEGDDETATVTVTYYILTGSDGTYTAQEYTGDKIDINSETGEPTFKFENSWQKYTEVTVEKSWEDGNDAYSTRPGSITINLLVNDEQAVDESGEPITAELSDANEWKVAWEDLPLYDGYTKLVYSIEEVEVGGYTTVIVTNTTTDDSEDVISYIFTVTNTLDEIPAEIQVSKSYVNNNGDPINTQYWPEDGFRFTLSAISGVDADGDELDVPLPSETTVWASDTETVSFDEIDYTVAGTYYYQITETSTDLSYITEDADYHYAKVVVGVDEETGVLTATVSYLTSEEEITDFTDDDYTWSASDTGAAFTNTYTASGNVQFTGSKYVTNDASDSTDKEFTFELYETDSSFATSGEAIDTQTTTGAGTFTFDEITYDEEGTYYYVIMEVQEEASGWAMDETVYYITVDVTDNLEGQLEAAVSYVTEIGGDSTTVTGSGDVYGGFDFTNEYEAEGEVTLGVVKSISGVASTDEEFEFTLYDSDESFATGDLIETIKTEGEITNSTELDFTAISYTEAGTYYYVITETGTAPDGWALDETEYHVTVTVTDNGDGTLTTSAAYVADGSEESENSAAFTNTYAATGELALTGTKTFTGGDLTADGFTFTMTDSTGASVGDVTMNAEGNITFPTLEYDETDIGGEYTYTITEVAGTDSSVQYDDTIYTVVVNVDDNGDGTLNVTYTVTADDETIEDITFTNYQTGSLIITKDFTGLDDDQIAELDDFTITVTNSDGDTVATRTLEDADEGSSYTWTVSGLPADTYTVTETGYSMDGYEVIARSGEVTVTDGEEVSADDALDWGSEDEIAFENDYIQVGSLNVSKHVVESENGTILELPYSVTITAQLEDGETVDFQWVTVTADGDVIDATIDSSAGTIEFAIQNGQMVNISGLPVGSYTVEENYSATRDDFTPIYRVGEQETVNAPTVTVSSDTESIVTVEIDNEFPVGTYIQVIKSYNGAVYPTGDDAFTFTIEALSCDLEEEDLDLSADEMPMPPVTTVTVTDGNVTTFGRMEFEYFGTYYYKITETQGSLDYVDYDSSVYYVKVVVTDSGETAAEGYDIETVTESYAKADAETDDYKDLDYTEADDIVTAEFDNTYDATGEVTLTATKEYTGAELTEGLFTFTITETTADATYTGTGTNDADGNITFDPEITYTLDDVGTHTYEITETAGDAGGVTYDSDTITVTVVVADNNDGTLATTVTVAGQEVTVGEEDGSYNVGTFENSYQATGSLTLGGTKTISGITSTTQQFEFSLYATDSDFTVADDAEAIDTQTLTRGDFTFETISYDSETENGAGTYYYVVTETSTDGNGWTMDTNEYHITVVVTDANDGTFTLNVTCVDAEGETVDLTQAEDGSHSFTGLDFANEYKPEPTSVQFTGSKYITNSTGTDKVFTFELYSADDAFATSGDAIQTKTTTGADTITFDAISYDTTGTYYYVIKEQALDEAEGWTIDETTVYNIAVTVTDDGLGQLVATVTVNGTEVSGTDDVYGGIDFTNAYAAEGDVTLGVVKSISGVASTDKEFEFTLYDSDESFATGDSIETITTDGTIDNSTSVNFTEIAYDAAGTYYYIIKETGTAPDGWALDETEYHVTVTVTDNGDGTLTTSAAYDVDGSEESENSAAFTNTYAATGELALTGTKIFTGGELTADSFTFTMTDSTGASVGDVTMDADGNITFPTLEYDETDIGGEYTYTIAEVDTEVSGVQYDDTTYTVVVSVADNGDGTLDVTYTVNGTANGDITFTNYQNGSLTISKAFTGLDDDQIAELDDFTITVTNSAGDAVATLTLVDADEGSAYIWTVSDLPADTYTVTETGYSLDGYEVIAAAGEVTVTDGSDVSVNDELAWGGEDTVEFTNDYTEVGTITVTKYVTAESDIQDEHADTEYTVVITADNKDADFQWVTVTSSIGRKITPAIEDNSITFTITENETVTIDGLPAGDYTVEEQGSDAMASEHCVPTYIVGEEETEDAPTVTVASGDENVVAVEIDNEYPIGTYIQIQKDYNKDEYPDGDDAFTFTIEALSADLDAGGTLSADEMPMPETSTVTITGSDDEHIALITFDDEENEFEHFGTYYYKITETKGSLDNIIYDESVHYVKVVVAFDNETHVVTTDEWEAKADAETDDYRNLDYTEAGIVTAEFTNTALEELSIEKEVSGTPKDTTEYQFEITLTNSDGTPFEGTVTTDSVNTTANKLAQFFSNIVKTFADDSLTFVDGKAMVTVTAGEKVTIMVPSGVTCTVTEVDSDADSVNVSVDGVYQAQSSKTEATAEVGTVADSTQVVFVNSYRGYFGIDEEIVTDTDDIFDRDAWVKDEAVNEYNAIEIEMTTNLPVITAYDLENGEFTMNFHEVLDSELVLDELESDFTVYIAGYRISSAYYTVSFDEDTGDDCNFHVDVDLTALYNDGVVTEDMLDGNTEITIFFFADLEGTGLNGSYKSTVWYDIYDGDEWLYTSNESVVEVYTYEIEILKYDASTLQGDDYASSALAGATLGVYYDEDCTEPVSRNGEDYTVTSGDDGMAIFYGLADGTYYVKETAAPSGYVLSDEVLEVELGEDLDGYAYEGVFANEPEDEIPTEPGPKSDNGGDDGSGGTGGSGSAGGSSGGQTSDNGQTSNPTEAQNSRTADADLPILPIGGCLAGIALLAAALAFRKRAVK